MDWYIVEWDQITGNLHSNIKHPACLCRKRFMMAKIWPCFITQQFFKALGRAISTWIPFSLTQCPNCWWRRLSWGWYILPLKRSMSSLSTFSILPHTISLSVYWLWTLNTAHLPEQPSNSKIVRKLIPFLGYLKGLLTLLSLLALLW